MYNKEFLLRFVIIAFNFLIIVLSISYLLFPWRPSSLWEELLMALQNPEQQQQSFFERLFDPGRTLPQKSAIRSVGAGKGTHLKGSGSIEASNAAMGLLNLNTEQLILRENILAQLILLDRHGLNEKKAWSTIRRIKGQGSYRDYEEQRFMSEIMWMNYFDERPSPAVLKKLKLTTLKLVEKPTAYFEDYYNAGIASLLNGDSSQALHYLQAALEKWPAKGRALGNVYFGLLMAHGVEENVPETLLLLDEFQEYYPDWLHVETYVPDIQELIGIYPNSPFLHIIHGRLVQNVHDNATAHRAYMTALAGINGKSEIYSNLRAWVKEIDNKNN